jgi:stage II sporulation protein AA (anti-sigma F factor antagonist)
MPKGLPFDLEEDAPADGMHVLAIRGEADMSTALEFNARFYNAAGGGKTAFIADLSEVSYMDTTMLNALIVGHRRMLRECGRFAVVCPGGMVARLLALTGVDGLLDVFETRAAAIAHVRSAA